MKKFLLTLATAFIAAFAMAQEYPVVTSVEELASYPDSTMVLFENLETVVVEKDMGYYVQTDYCLSDGTTIIGGNVYPVPAKFTAVGYLHTAEDWEGATYREFYVEEVKYVTTFATLGDLITFASSRSNYDIMMNSKRVKAESGNVFVTHVLGDYIFYYTVVKGYYGNNMVYGVMSYPGASDMPNDCFVGAEIMPENGWTGFYTPTKNEYDEEDNLISHKGGCFALVDDCRFWPLNYSPYKLPYESTDFESVLDNYVAEASLVRFAPGGTFVEKDGKYFYEVTFMAEVWDDETWEYKEIEQVVSIEVASANIDLASMVGTVSEEYLCGVWDYCNTGDTDRLLLNEFMGTVSHYYYISDLTSMGSQYEEEIPAEFDVPLTVTYKYDDGTYKFILIVADESGALALDYSEAVAYDDNGDPTADYAALRTINVGDAITGVKGFAQYNTDMSGAKLYCAFIDYNADDYPTITYLPTVASSGNKVNVAMTITLEDMLSEWRDCTDNGGIPKIANNVVRVLDVQVLDTLDQWGDEVKYLVQGTDTMELSNIWGDMNFELYERNNIVGIADYYTLNSNGLYQLMPLSQESITDASIVPEVTTLEELKANEGVLSVVKNVTIKKRSEGYYIDYVMFDEVYVANFNVEGTFDLFGLYDGGAFAVYEVRNAYGFGSIADLNTYVSIYPDAAGQAYEITNPLLVTHVEGDYVFVQYEGVGSWGQAIRSGNVLIGANIDVKRGDMIQGLKGVSTPCDYTQDEYYTITVHKGASFTVAEDAELTVVSSDNAIDYGQAQELVYMTNSIADLQGNALKIKPVGEVLEDGGRYYYREESYSWDPETETDVVIYYTLELVSSEVDLAEWVGAELEGSIIGVLDYMNTTDDEAKLYVHGLASNNIEYQNIGEVLAAGPLSDYTMTVSVANPVVVTYVYDAGWSAGVTVQDETGAIFLSLYDPMTVENIKVGDMLSGIKGGASWGGGQAPALFGYNADSYVDYPLDVVSSGHDVAAVTATIAELNAERDIFANYQIAYEWVNRLVLLQNVTFDYAIDEGGEEWPCLKQGEDVLFVVKNFAELFSVEKGQSFDVVGVADYNRMNLSGLYTIHPRSAADFFSTGVEGIEADNNGIYLDAAYQVVAPGAVAVALYDMNGRQVGTTDAAGLAEGVYVVRATYADGAVVAAKVVR